MGVSHVCQVHITALIRGKMVKLAKRRAATAGYDPSLWFLSRQDFLELIFLLQSLS